MDTSLYASMYAIIDWCAAEYVQLHTMLHTVRFVAQRCFSRRAHLRQSEGARAQTPHTHTRTERERERARERESQAVRYQLLQACAPAPHNIQIFIHGIGEYTVYINSVRLHDYVQDNMI